MQNKLKKVASFDDLANSGHYKIITVDANTAQDIRLSNGANLLNGKEDCLVLENAMLLSTGIAIDDCWVADTIHYMPADWKEQSWLSVTGTLDNDYIGLNEKRVANATRLDGTYFLPDMIVGHRNFGHFIHDTCSSYRILLRAKAEYPEIKLLYMDGLYDNMEWLIKHVYAAGIDIFFSAQRPLILERAVVPRRQTVLGNLKDNPSHWQIPAEALMLFAKDARSKVVADNEAAGNRSLRLYLHRHQPDIADIPDEKKAVLQGRYFKDLQKSLTQLVDSGFIVLEPGQLRQDTIIRLISCASVIVGIHGAGLCNAAFAHPGTRVFEIRQNPGTWHSVEALLRASGLAYNSIEYKADPEFQSILPVSEILDKVSQSNQ
jgi:capsular polysaccharide biosynthesis protein